MATAGTPIVFATGPTANSGLDSLTYGHGSLWAEYGNGAVSTGGSGSSTIVQYSLSGQVQHTYTISGSDDGLKVDPLTGYVWVLQNQDGNSTLSLIDPTTGAVSAPLKYAAPYVYGTDSTRGYDDVAFIGGKVYLSYTNPNGSGDPVIQQLSNGHVPFGPLVTTNILLDGATGLNTETGQIQAIPLNDPDSLKATPGGGLVLTSSSDNSFTLISHPGAADQSARFVQLQGLPAGSALDDVIVTGASAGTLYIADQGNNRIVKVSLSGLTANQQIVSVGTEVGIVDDRTGLVTPLVTGVSKSHGLSFVAERVPTVVSERTFATAPHGASAPDSVTSGNGSVWVEYGNGATSTGGQGHSTIVEYSRAGQVEHTYSIAGSVDGLKVDPVTGDVWALQNQDGNSTLRLINPATGQVSAALRYAAPYVYGANSTRGYDDVAFDRGKVYLSYTNPTQNGQAVIQQLVNGDSPFGALVTTDILKFGATGTNLTTGATDQVIPLNDPDSLKTLANGSLLLTSGNDSTLIFINDPGTAQQSQSFIQLPAGSSGLDDAVQPASTSGTFYVSSSGSNSVVAAEVTGLNPNDLYASLSSSNAIVQIDPTNGTIVPVVTGLSSPHGLVFVPSAAAPVAAAAPAPVAATLLEHGFTLDSAVTLIASASASFRSSGSLLASTDMGAITPAHATAWHDQLAFYGHGVA